MNYSIMVPSRKRPQLLINLIHTINETVEDKTNVEVIIAYDFEDHLTIEALNTIKSKNYLFAINQVGRSRSPNINNDYYNWMATNFTNGKYLIAINDDTIFKNYAWDSMALKKIDKFLENKKDDIFYGITTDGEIERKRNEHNFFTCFPLISKSAVTALGFFFDPSFYKDGADWDIILPYKHINRVLDLRSEIIIEHISVRSGRRTKDILDCECISPESSSAGYPRLGANLNKHSTILSNYIQNKLNDELNK